MKIISNRLFMGTMISAPVIIGIAPVVGSIGLIAIGAKTVVDVAKRTFAQMTSSNRTNLESLNHKIRGDIAGLKSFLSLSIPIFGIPLFLKFAPIGVFAGFIASMISNAEDGLHNHLIFPLRGESFESYAVERGVKKEAFKHFREELIKPRTWHSLKKEAGELGVLTTEDKRQVDYAYFPGWRPIDTPFDPKASTVIFFHGNGTTLDTSHPWVKLYNNQGVNVLCVTLGGYPAFAEGKQILTTERTACYDALAAVKFLEERGVKREHLLAHGFSIGGTLASFLGAEGRVGHVVLDHTLSTLSDVGTNMIGSWNFPYLTPHLKDAVHYFTQNLEWEHKKRASLLIGTKTPLDGLNNVNKVSLFKNTTFVVIRSEEDEMMHSPEINCGEKLINVYNRTHSSPAEEILVTGDHNDTSYLESGETESELFSRLQTSGFMKGAMCPSGGFVWADSFSA